uniref:(northern house mosquito) hypothetical protein n=1 Tax=Culex pipiens TaxID=7175 RepID=A0A8D8HDH5_CULPI
MHKSAVPKVLTTLSEEKFLLDYIHTNIEIDSGTSTVLWRGMYSAYYIDLLFSCLNCSFNLLQLIPSGLNILVCIILNIVEYVPIRWIRISSGFCHEILWSFEKKIREINNRNRNASKQISLTV